MFSKIRQFLRWFLGAFCVLLLLIFAAIFYLIPVHNFMAEKASEIVSDELQTHVTLGKIIPSLPHGIVLEDFCIYDQHSDTLLAVAHADATINLLQLLQGNIIIPQAQLFGYHIQLVDADSIHPANYQFLVDKLSSEDTTKTELNLQLRHLVIRNGWIRYNKNITIQDLELNGSFKLYNSNYLYVDIQKLAIKELNNYFKLDSLSLQGNYNLVNNDFEISRFAMQSKQSKLHLKAANNNGNLSAKIFDTSFTPANFSTWMPALESFVHPLSLHAFATCNSKTFNLKELSVNAEGLTTFIQADGTFHSDTTLSTAALHLETLNISHQLLEHVAQAFNLDASYTSLFSELGNVWCDGDVNYESKKTLISSDIFSKFQITSNAGNVFLSTSLHNNEHVNLQLQTEQLNVGKIITSLTQLPISQVNANFSAKGNIKHGTLVGQFNVPSFSYQEQQIQALTTNFSLSSKDIQVNIALDDEVYRLHADAKITSPTPIQFNSKGLQQLEGSLKINDVAIEHPQQKAHLDNFLLTTHNNETGHHIAINSDFIDANIDGDFNYATLPNTLKKAISKTYPTVYPALKESSLVHNNELNLFLSLKQSPLVTDLFGDDFQLQQPVNIEGFIAQNDTSLLLNASAPALQVGKFQLRNILLKSNQVDEKMKLRLSLQDASISETDTLSLVLAADAADDLSNAIFSWNTLTPSGYDGTLSLSSTLSRDSLHQFVNNIHFNPTNISIANQVWNVKESDVNIHPERIEVNHVGVAQNQKHLLLNGVVSDKTTDSILISLNDIHLEKVLALVNFEALKIAGNTRGSAVVRNIKVQPTVDSQLHVDDFAIYNGKMGVLDINLGWGRKKAGALDLLGTIIEPMRGECTELDGIIDLGESALNLKVDAHNLNIDFLNHFTKNFFNRLHARTTGLCTIFGTFHDIDLMGDMQLDTFAVTMDVCGARYHAFPGDSIILRPGEIGIRHVHIHDDQHLRDNRAHAGEVNGLVTHTKLRRFYYNINVKTNDILTFNKPNAGEISGVAYTDGNVHVTGTPTSLDVEINATPRTGTEVVYDLTTPDATTNNEFIRFVDRDVQNVTVSSSKSKNNILVVPDRDDTHVNINITATPDLALKFKMGSNGSDNINLFGSGTIHAHYYNKGAFDIYGTYRVDNGTYQLSLQDIIRKDFQFNKGGTLVFGGDPAKAAINLQAVHTVSGVNLNDLTANSNFSNSTVRVNCLLNITGYASDPRLSFDFDIPNVNEDEKQMIRTMISTDEERNMQILYLLGLGRFYTYDATNQTNAAMQGLLSSTLSGQLNNILSNALGNSNWNVGTSFSTGTLGWQDMDIEGMLSGRLLNNRLLINGTFGYRNTPISNSNFIGDFDVQWFFTKSGHLSLKAYSETNDRYFTKTALTTQGVGLQVQKDFSNMRDLFGIKKKKK